MHSVVLNFAKIDNRIKLKIQWNGGNIDILFPCVGDGPSIHEITSSVTSQQF